MLLRLHGEIPLSLLCSPSSWSSALVLAPTLHVGRPQASVPCPDRRGLKQRLITGLWLTQARVREGYGSHNWNVGQPAVAEVSVTLQQAEAHHVFSRGSCLWITRPRQWRASQAPGVGWCGERPELAHRILGGTGSSLSVSRPSLWSELIAMAHTHLWSLFRQCSESPLLAHPVTMVSCLFGRSRLFPRLLPASCGSLAPSGCLHAANLSPLPEA